MSPATTKLNSILALASIGISLIIATTVGLASMAQLVAGANRAAQTKAAVIREALMGIQYQTLDGALAVARVAFQSEASEEYRGALADIGERSGRVRQQVDRLVAVAGIAVPFPEASQLQAALKAYEQAVALALSELPLTDRTRADARLTALSEAAKQVDVMLLQVTQSVVAEAKRDREQIEQFASMVRIALGILILLILAMTMLLGNFFRRQFKAEKFKLSDNPTVREELERPQSRDAGDRDGAIEQLQAVDETRDSKLVDVAVGNNADRTAQTMFAEAGAKAAVAAATLRQEVDRLADTVETLKLSRSESIGAISRAAASSKVAIRRTN